MISQLDEQLLCPYIEDNAFRLLNITPGFEQESLPARKLELLRDYGLKQEGIPLLFPERPLQRDAELIERCVKALEDERDAVLHEFFWFEPLNGREDQALQALYLQDYTLAKTLWQEQTSVASDEYNPLAWKHLALLLLWRYLISGDVTLRSQSQALFTSYVADDVGLDGFLNRVKARHPEWQATLPNRETLRVALFTVIRQIYERLEESHPIAPPRPVMEAIPPVTKQPVSTATDVNEQAPLPEQQPESIETVPGVKPTASSSHNLLKFVAGALIVATLAGVWWYFRKESVTLRTQTDVLTYECYQRDHEGLKSGSFQKHEANFTKMGEMDSTLQKLEKEKNELTTQRSEAERQRASVGSQIAESSRTLNRNTQLKQEAEAEAARLEQRYNSGANYYSDTPGVVEYSYSIDEYNGDLDALKTKHNDYKIAIESAQGRISQLNTQLANATGQVKRFDELMATKESERANLKQEQDRLLRSTTTHIEQRKRTLDARCTLKETRPVEKTSPIPLEA